MFNLKCKDNDTEGKGWIPASQLKFMDYDLVISEPRSDVENTNFYTEIVDLAFPGNPSPDDTSGLDENQEIKQTGKINLINDISAIIQWDIPLINGKLMKDLSFYGKKRTAKYAKNEDGTDNEEIAECVVPLAIKWNSKTNTFQANEPANLYTAITDLFLPPVQNARTPKARELAISKIPQDITVRLGVKSSAPYGESILLVIKEGMINISFYDCDDPNTKKDETPHPIVNKDIDTVPINLFILQLGTLTYNYVFDGNEYVDITLQIKNNDGSFNFAEATAEYEQYLASLTLKALQPGGFGNDVIYDTNIKHDLIQPGLKSKPFDTLDMINVSVQQAIDQRINEIKPIMEQILQENKKIISICVDEIVADKIEICTSSTFDTRNFSTLQLETLSKNGFIIKGTYIEWTGKK